MRHLKAASRITLYAEAVEGDKRAELYSLKGSLGPLNLDQTDAGIRFLIIRLTTLQNVLVVSITINF